MVLETVYGTTYGTVSIMVLPRIANPFRAFLGRCRFESGLFRHRGQHIPGTSFFSLRIFHDSRKDGTVQLVPAAAPI